MNNIIIIVVIYFVTSMSYNQVEKRLKSKNMTWQEGMTWIPHRSPLLTNFCKNDIGNQRIGDPATDVAVVINVLAASNGVVVVCCKLLLLLMLCIFCYKHGLRCWMLKSWTEKEMLILQSWTNWAFLCCLCWIQPQILVFFFYLDSFSQTLNFIEQ